jgi:hypothetical protein
VANIKGKVVAAMNYATHHFQESENGNYFENIQHFNFAYKLWVRKVDCNSLTGTKN